ncbi:GNAT family N-acetyltransferase [Agreia pratensis]|uniref:GNAT family N-acetyltransferase n=1 Tax=Agreia pratensis TaxID=150121 RepID=UPI00188B41A8|nr:GNAT family N-acetyltransferase [Agreia pratensis]
MTLLYRPASLPDDETWLFQLHEDAHRALVEAAYGPWVVEQQQEFFRALVDDHRVFIVESDHTKIGAVYLGERDGDAWLELIEISPSWQGSGFGAAALGWVRETASKSGQRVLLQVHRINERARQLYLREGFTKVSQTDTHHVMRSNPTV